MLLVTVYGSVSLPHKKKKTKKKTTLSHYEIKLSRINVKV